MMIRIFFILITVFFFINPLFADEIPMDRLNNFAKQMLERSNQAVGYPVNQNIDLKEFYQWYLDSGLHGVAMNNVGNPRKHSPYSMNTHEFENEVIGFFTPLYGFEPHNTWGIVTFSGTDGNNHGIYFGGFLPFTGHKEIVDRKKIYFDSIAVSGHKFFGFDDPMGIFITTREVLDNQNPFKVPYLLDAVPTITCSRSALGALKFWWKVQRTG